MQRRPQEAAQEAAAAPQGAFMPPAASMANTQHTMATACAPGLFACWTCQKCCPAALLSDYPLHIESHPLKSSCILQSCACQELRYLVVPMPRIRCQSALSTRRCKQELCWRCKNVSRFCAGLLTQATPGGCSSFHSAIGARRFVDPSDPSKVFLTSPVDEAHRAPSAPVYAPNYAATQHERYEPMEPPRPPPAV